IIIAMIGSKRLIVAGFLAAALVFAAVVLAVPLMQHGSRTTTLVGPGMMNGYAGGMMGGGNVSSNATRRPSPSALGAVRDRVERWLQSPGLSGFRVSEVMAFTNNDYVAVQDARGKPAFELLTAPSGWLMEEPPSMMWNTRYGMMGRASRSWTGSGMMGGGMMSGNWTGRYGTGNGWDGGGQGTVTSLAQAVKVADRWLSQARQGERAETDGRAFPGYYTLDTTRSGKTTGMLSVNASTGAVWYHSWHGRFLAERKF
ncbi:MAG TPA: hypothetical protein VIM76_05320, partial [Candidatus Dormibacteraeota bacterium]